VSGIKSVQLRLTGVEHCPVDGSTQLEVTQPSFVQTHPNGGGAGVGKFPVVGAPVGGVPTGAFVGGGVYKH
jgi:hypothetical protein